MGLFLGLPSAAWAVLSLEFVERLGYYAVAFSLFTYCTVMLQTGPAMANALISIVYILVPAAAFLASGVADSRAGRPRVLAMAVAAYTTALLLLYVSATPWLYTSFPLNPKWESRALFALALLGFSAGYGSMKVCTNPIMADCVVLHYRNTFDEAPTILDGDDAETGVSSASRTESAATGVTAAAGDAPMGGLSFYGATNSIDAAASHCGEEHVKAALSRLFVYAYWVGNAGGLVGTFVAPLVRNFESRRLVQGSEEHTTGYYYSFLLATLSVGVGGALLCWCFAWLPRNDPAPNFVLVRVIVLALQNRWAVLRGTAQAVPGRGGGISDPEDWLDYASLKLRSVSSGSWGIADAPHVDLDEGAVSFEQPTAASHALSGSASFSGLDGDATGTSLWVSDCRATLQICKAFIALPIYWLICNQFSTNLMYQAAALEMPVSAPEELFNNINTATMLLFLALWDQWLLPRVLRHRVPSACLRIVSGFACMCASMLWCGFLQCFITSRGYYESDERYVLREGQRKLSAGWLVMPYILQGLASAFVDPSVMEVAYRDAPERMRGTVMGLYWAASSASGFLGFALSPVMKPEKAVPLFFCFAAAQMAVSVLFYFVNCGRY
ncbi:hypothetical protein LSCM1_02559 [Leishmania martiniquensis]|uniref:POT family protein n=1 Tax=Leishmania martiniquensis TaxID=1580590 RepID=A0A836GC21_9TRYP|nr:hypothetical protein LSCM1_02559 [Leishmania martiniquensis]